MRRIPFEAWLAVLIVLSHLYAALVPANSLMEWFHSDDAFYYFKTAQNIVDGRGITFDGLGKASGFHPLWMAALLPVYALGQGDLIPPLRIVVMISGLLNAGTAVLLYRMSRRSLAALPAAFAGLFWAFYPQIRGDVIEMGLESGLSAFLLALLLYRVVLFGQVRGAEGEDGLSGSEAYSLALTGLTAALAVLARLDNIFLVIVMGAWLAVRPPRMRYLLAADAALVALGVLWSFMKRVGFGPAYAQAADSALWMAAAAMALRLGIYYLAGLYRAPAPGVRGLAAFLVKAAAASALASALLGGVMLALHGLGAFSGFPRLTLVYEAGFAVAALLGSRLAAAAFRARRGEDEQGGKPLALRALFFPDGGPCPEFRWRASLGRAAAYFTPVILLLALYIGAHMAYFGTPSPVSGQIKRWWGTLPNTIYGRPAAGLGAMVGLTARGGPWSLVRSLAAEPAGIAEPVRLAVFGGLALVLVALRGGRAARAFDRLALFPLFIGGFIQMISYTGTGYLHTRSWYWVANMLLITVLLGLLLDLWLSFFSAREKQQSRAARLPAAAVVGLCALVVIAQTWRTVDNMPWQVSAENAEYYVIGVRELEAATEPGAIIGSTGGGVIAYFVKDRTIVNLDGLMNTTAYFEALKSGKAAAYLDEIGLDYVYSGAYAITNSDPYFQFSGRLEQLSHFGGSTLFRWKR